MRFFAMFMLLPLFWACHQSGPEKRTSDEARMERMGRLVAMMDSAGPSSPPVVPKPSAVDENRSAVPVENLLAGLEARLAAEPNDVAGWSLLAQSYAFVGRDQDAARAMEKAVALGADKGQLESRVASASRSLPVNHPKL